MPAVLNSESLTEVPMPVRRSNTIEVIVLKHHCVGRLQCA